MNNQNDKAAMLRAMLAGQPTKESQELAMKTKLYQDPKNVQQVNPQHLHEQVSNAPLPSASDMVISNSDMMLARTGARALPAVSENDIVSMLSGKGVQRQQRPQVQQPAPQPYVAPVPDYFAPSDGYAAGANQTLDNFDVNAAMRQRLAQRQPLNEQKQMPMGIDPNTIVDLVEDIVYSVLGQLVQEANENKLNKESIRMKIGESIFSGKLEKSLTVPKKK